MQFIFFLKIYFLKAILLCFAFHVLLWIMESGWGINCFQKTKRDVAIFTTEKVKPDGENRLFSFLSNFYLFFWFCKTILLFFLLKFLKVDQNYP